MQEDMAIIDKITIPYSSLPLSMRLCFKPYKKADGTHELCCRWWYALYFGIKFAFNVRFEAQEKDEMDESI
jgi:hypothetical protein